MEQLGLKFCLDRTDIATTRLRGLIEDTRETAAIPLNSASGNWNVSQAVNLFDGSWHTVVFTWACDDTTAFPTAGVFGTSALQKGICMVDGIILGNEAVQWKGKSTPLEFIWSDSGIATFLGLGAKMGGDAATSQIAYTNVTEPASMIIKRLCIWDRPLGPTIDVSTSPFKYGITNGYTMGDGRFPWQGGTVGSIWSQFSVWGLDQAEGQPALSNYWDSLTGFEFKCLSGNVVAYYKFNELLDSAITGQDSAGFDFNASTSGWQRAPTFGNPMNWYGALVQNGDYLIYDVPDPNEDGVMKTGLVVFEDGDGIRRQVGFINYDLGFVILDGEHSGNSITGVPFLRSIGLSGMSFTQSMSANNFYVKKINFTSEEFIESMVLNLAASGLEMNQTENPTGIEQTTGGQLLFPTATWPQSVGLYNDYNDLVGIAKFNTPIRKDEDHNVLAQVKLDFSGTYPTGAEIVP